MKTEIIKITPFIAEGWLKKNTNNIRAVDHRKVDAYAGMMSRNAWPTTHQGIAFDEYGQLVDGQHRLHAIMKSGKSIFSLVSFDVQSDAVTVIDRGLRRNAAVVLGEDKRVSEMICFITRILYSSNFGDDELLQVKNCIGSYCNELISVCGSCRKSITASSIRSAFVTAYIQSEDSEVLTNYRRFVCLNVGEPESVLNTPPSLRVLHHRIGASRIRLTPTAAFAYTYRAINNLESKTVSITEEQLPSFLAVIRKFYRKKFNLCTDQ